MPESVVLAMCIGITAVSIIMIVGIIFLGFKLMFGWDSDFIVRFGGFMLMCLGLGAGCLFFGILWGMWDAYTRGAF